MYLRSNLPTCSGPGEAMEHKLMVRPGTRLVQQKVRKQSFEQQEFIRQEVDKLLLSGFIREVHHPEWLANSIVVPKACGKLRMCIDYTDLNKALKVIGCSSLRGGGGELGTNKNLDLWLQLVCTKLKLTQAI